jgi:hypothetical protein
MLALFDISDRCREIPCTRSPLPTPPARRGVRRHPRSSHIFNTKVRHGFEENAVPEHRLVGRFDAVQGIRRPSVVGDQEACVQRHEDSSEYTRRAVDAIEMLNCSYSPDRRASRTPLLHMDGRFDFGLARYIQENVGLKARIRRRGPTGHPSENVLRPLYELSEGNSYLLLFF